MSSYVKGRLRKVWSCSGIEGSDILSKKMVKFWDAHKEPYRFAKKYLKCLNYSLSSFNSLNGSFSSFIVQLISIMIKPLPIKYYQALS